MYLVITTKGWHVVTLILNTYSLSYHIIFSCLSNDVSQTYA